MKIKPLPPLRSLVAFEAAARHLSFTRAAEELCVTQGAVSKQIRILEDHLGQDLFVRHKSGLIMTPQGNRYATTVSGSLQSISDATTEIIGARRNSQVNIVTTGAVASLWLIPRFAEFQEVHPEIESNIEAVPSYSRIGHKDFDIGVFYCAELPRDMQARELFPEKVFPVCSPAFLTRNPGIKNPRNIASSRLLVLDTDEQWVNWDQWLTGCGLEKLGGDANRVNINDHSLLIQAALNGQGLALAWDKLIDRFIDDGRLVVPTDQVLDTGSKFYLVARNFSDLEPDSRALVDFLEAA